MTDEDECPICKFGMLKEGEPLCRWGKAVSWDLYCLNCMSEFRQERGGDWLILADNFTKETEQDKKAREANARLIAAAPTLLQALKEVEKLFSENPHAFDANMDCVESTYVLIAEAIKRAEGGEG